MDSASFFPEPPPTKQHHQHHLKVIAPVATQGTSNYIVPSPRRPMDEMFATTNLGGTASPSVISKSYSDVDIDSVLRETEELVQSIL